MRIIDTLVSAASHARALLIPVAAVVAVKFSEGSSGDSTRFYHETHEKALLDAVAMGLERVC